MYFTFSCGGTQNVYKIGENELKYCAFLANQNAGFENTMHLENANHSSATSHCPAP